MKPISLGLLVLLAACGSSNPTPDGGRCTPGQSVACVGAGACQGGQTCQPDGLSFGTCECAATNSSGTTSGSAATGTTGGSGSGIGSGVSGGSAGGTTGATGGGVPCAPGATWVGNVCAVSACTSTVNGDPCSMADGGIGSCAGTSCIDVTNDPTNCGRPGYQCAEGLSCTAGACVGGGGCSVDGGCPAGTGCFLGLFCLSETCSTERSGLSCATSDVGIDNLGTCCGATCTTLADPENCGGCGITCNPGKFCGTKIMGSSSATACIDCTDNPDNSSCPISDGGLGLCCGGTCQPVANSDPLNCGFCGLQCPGGAAGACANGICSGDCNDPGCPAGTACADYGTHAACQPTSCVAGAIGSACTTGLGGASTCCGGTACVLINDDPNNCGNCGIVCGPGEVCQNYTCVIVPTPPASCATESDGAVCALTAGTQGVCCSGTCTDPSSDATNCGSCGSVCPAAATCVASACNPATCESGGDCPAGVPCVESFCSPSCVGRADGERCAASQSDGGELSGTCCAGACAPIATDPQNCGGCGLVCPAGFACDSSACHQGASAFVCGAAGMVTCPVGATCAGAPACTPLSCTGRQNGDACAFGPGLTGECCGGVCLDVNDDQTNCGGCGLACPSSSSLCLNGACYPLDTASCTPACSSGQICLDGQCASSFCGGNYLCLARDGQAGACCGGGACIDLEVDPDNCGNCGTPCPAGEACSGGACQGDVCSINDPGAYCSTPGLPNACCGNACIDTATDPANCGSCGNVCSSGTCSGGACS